MMRLKTRTSGSSGEAISDEDEGFHPDDNKGTPQPETDSGDSEDEDQEGGADEEEGGEQAQLCADLSRSGVGSVPLLLAHMTDKSASPLTPPWLP